jgi:hypothetical protein
MSGEENSNGSYIKITAIRKKREWSLMYEGEWSK